MRKESIQTCIAFLLSYAAAVPITAPAQQPKPGGYATGSVASKEVVAVANFAVNAHQKAMQEKKMDPHQMIRIPLTNVVKSPAFWCHVSVTMPTARLMI